MVKPHSSNFRVIKTIFWGVRKLRVITVMFKSIALNYILQYFLLNISFNHSLLDDRLFGTWNTFCTLATTSFRKIYLVTFFSIFTGYYDSECMIDNPFYIDPSSDCSGCVSVKQVKEFQAEDFDSSKVGNYITFMRPVLIKVCIIWAASRENLSAGFPTR